MRIKELHLKNWTVIREASFANLGDFVVIAGPNGVGKTKVKESIVHIFNNGGNPPAGSSVILEATSTEERTAWGSNEVTLPQGFFASFFNSQQKRLKTKSRLIQIDSNRSVDSVSFQNLSFNQIGNPEEEAVDYNYGFNNVKSRFTDICRTLHRLKSKEVTSVYKEYQANMQTTATSVQLNKLADPTEKYVNMFNQLLYPKKMMPIDINSTTIQFKDDDGGTRQFSELSSGEKEVVILTFDILTQNPYDCLILIDEPEVHLHPELTFRLIKALKSIGERNQYFMFTHSPDIIGSSFDSGIYFIRPKVRAPTGNQVVRVDESNLDELKTIPNIRETIGMISVGKKLLFVEGTAASLDRKIFATIAKESKIDLAIIPSDSCSNINNMALMCETLEKGLFGVEIAMIRDRDSLTSDQVKHFETKSKGKLVFLPFYHIENAFLVPKAIEVVAKKILLDRAPSLQDIERKMTEFAKAQISHTVSLYVKNEVYFEANNFDITPKIQMTAQTDNPAILQAMKLSRDSILADYTSKFGDNKIKERLDHWRNVLDTSLTHGWSADARKYFLGKRLLKDMQGWLFGTKNILLWEHILMSNEDPCIEARSELEEVLKRI